MSKLIIPDGYKAALSLQQTEIAIKKIKDFFLSSISTELRLRRVTAPLFVLKGLGMNDDLSGTERPVTFPVKDMGDAEAEVVHSLAKWKRVTLAEYQVKSGYGIITDMNAIRADEELDNLHSLYVDQWDWERVMDSNMRTVEYLKNIVNRIYNSIFRTEYYICETYPQIEPFLPENITFIHAEELLQRYPDMTAKEREDAICKEYGAVFIIGIGGKLSNGEVHDHRAPDYDDYSTVAADSNFAGLNGDLLVWYPILGRAVELSSMGIRVDSKALEHQLQLSGKEDRRNL
ncbi:MAG: aspartate--ammonia ligase, partial [Alistipes sp.]|nr:aspartate--ammonia ligase [Alistipes sp.]